MASNQESGAKSRVSAMVPTNHKEVLFMIAQERTQDRRENVPMAEIVREIVEDWLAGNYQDLPPEAKDLLDDDLKANAGAGEVTVEIDDTGVEN